MREGLNELGGLASLAWSNLAKFCGITCLVGMVWTWMRSQQALSERKQWTREEVAAYDRLDVRQSPDESVGELGRRVCRVVASHSPFYRVAVMVRAADRLSAVSSVGMDNLAVRALNAWGEQSGEAKRGNGSDSLCGECGGMYAGRRCFGMVLRVRPEDIGFGRAIVVPVRSMGGAMIGALVVGADGMLGVPSGVMDATLAPLEALAVKMGRAMESGAVEFSHFSETVREHGGAIDAVPVRQPGMEVPVELSMEVRVNLPGTEEVMEKSGAGWEERLRIASD